MDGRAAYAIALAADADTCRAALDKATRCGWRWAEAGRPGAGLCGTKNS